MSDVEENAGSETPEGAPATEPKDAPIQRGPLDMAMRGAVMVAIGVFITAPLWCNSQQQGEFRGATQFRAERPEEDDSLEGKLATIIEEVIRTAAADQEVDEVAASRRLTTELQGAELGDRQQRADAAGELIANILAQAAETSNLGLSQFQDQAITGQARVMARSLITRLGGEIEIVADDVEGEWTTASWPILSGFEYEERMELPAEVTALDGQNVMAWGYLIHLEDDQFLLVQSLWSCCFGAPPDLHEAVVVRAPDETRRFEGRGVRVYGRFEASEMLEDGYVTSLYRLDSEHIRAM